MAIQFCYDLNADNLLREVNGLAEALNELGLSEGFNFTLLESGVMSKS